VNPLNTSLEQLITCNQLRPTKKRIINREPEHAEF